jgi:hypothetical protein
MIKIGVSFLEKTSPMVNFLHKIRRRLLSQSSFSKYLFYAIGEIVLVVLGILIALKINNVNTNRVNEQLEISYLSAINGNIAEDINDLTVRLTKDSLHLDAYTQLIHAFTSDSIKADEERLKFLIHNSAIINYFNPQNTVFEEMKSSGKLQLIISDSLRYGIMEYYKQSRKVVTSQGINNQLIMDYRSNSLDKYLDMNSLIESQLPERWSAEISPFDARFFTTDILDPEVENFARSISLMKAGVFINHNWKVDLLESAKLTQSNIGAYLDSK